MRKFEYDISKSESNEAKHGISFEAAQELWNDADAVKLDAGEHGEVKFYESK